MPSSRGGVQQPGRAERLGVERVFVLGVPVHRVGMAEAEEIISAFVAGHRPGQKTRLVLTPNPEIIFAAQRDAELRSILNEADLAVPDGTGVVWATRILGKPVRERVAGIDLMNRLLETASRKGWRVYFLGTRQDTLNRAMDRLKASFPGLVVSGSHHGYFSPGEERGVVEDIRMAHPHLLFVGMGAPREQRFLWKWRDELGAAVAMGVGGSFDVLGGAIRRAPLWMRRVHLEWLFRLIQQPSRWRRMLALPRFALAVLKEAGRGRV